MLPTATLDGPAVGDPLDTARDHLLLGRSFSDQPQPVLAGVRPFGVSLAVAPSAGREVDMSAVSYDPVRQIGVVRLDGGGVIELAKHSTGWTNTGTDWKDSQPGDSDQDAMED